jgi:glutaredoxin 3
MPTSANTINVPHATAAIIKPPASPSAAPIKLNLRNLQPTFDRLWERSLAAGAREHGCIIVSDTSGRLKNTNIVVGEEGSVSLNYSVGSGETLQGAFHTHPYKSGTTGSSFSGADVAIAVNKGYRIEVVQSGRSQFLLLRSQRTPSRVDHGSFVARHETLYDRALSETGSMPAATQRRSKEMAIHFHMAYYEGADGIFWRVQPPVTETDLQVAAAGQWKGGNIIDCVALVTGRDVETVKKTAQRLERYRPDEGLAFLQVRNILGDLGVSSTRLIQPGNWSAMPDFALASVLDINGERRSVVFRREGGAERVYEGNHQPHESSRYRLAPNDYCLQIQSSTSFTKSAARLANNVSDHEGAEKYPRAQRCVTKTDLHVAAAGEWKGGNIIDCVALVTGRDAETVKKTAQRLERYRPDEGLAFLQVRNILGHLGVSSTRRIQPGEWSAMPDFALVSVLDTNGDKRSAVFRREGGAERVYEGNNQPRETSIYRLAPNDYCLQIDSLTNFHPAAAHPAKNVSGNRRAALAPESVRPAAVKVSRSGGDIIDCIALVVDEDRATVKHVAEQLVDYKPGARMRFTQVENVLPHFGVWSRRHTQRGDWRSLPDLALVSVIDRSGEKRAVVFRREGGSERVYEGNERPRETSKYQLVKGDPCLEIRLDPDLPEDSEEPLPARHATAAYPVSEQGTDESSFGGVPHFDVDDNGWGSDGANSTFGQMGDDHHPWVYPQAPMMPPTRTFYVQDGVSSSETARVAPTRAGSKTAPVKMYTTGTCRWCDRAKELLRERGVMHIEEVRVDLDGYEGQKMRQITGRNTVPQIFIDGEHIGGFDDLKKLDDRGGLKRRLRGGE